jgi:bifunctional DNase/RNase
MDIEMKIRGLMMDPVTNMPIVVLKDVNGDAILPIWVGIPEAHAIHWEIEKLTPPRPMTHDLLKNALQGLNARIQKVIVNELRDDTFYAVICLEQNGEQVCMDARPSDAIALALRVDCPVYVSEQVLKNSRIAASGAENMTADELRRWLENLNDEDLGRYKM